MFTFTKHCKKRVYGIVMYSVIAYTHFIVCLYLYLESTTKCVKGYNFLDKYEIFFTLNRVESCKVAAQKSQDLMASRYLPEKEMKYGGVLSSRMMKNSYSIPMVN